MQVSHTLTRGANLTSAQLASLRHDGYRAVVSLNLEGDDDAEHAADVGLRAISVPVLDRWCPTVAQAKRFLDVVTSAENQPVYVHCATGGSRTSILVACYRLAVERWSLSRALHEATATARANGGHGLSSEQVAFVASFHRQLEAGQVEGY